MSFKKRLCSKSSKLVKGLNTKTLPCIAVLWTVWFILLNFSFKIMLFEGATETVCVIGLVKVKVLGTVQNGERVYAAVHQPGVAIPETHIPLRAMAGRTPTLLGQALESKTSYKQDSVHLVHCFVSIVLGIQSGQLANAINDLQEGMQGRFEDVMVKNRSKWLKGQERFVSVLFSRPGSDVHSRCALKWQP